MDGEVAPPSVFSAAFLVRGRVRPQGGRAVYIVVVVLHLKLMFFAALRFTVFFGPYVYQLSCHRCILLHCLSRVRPQGERAPFIILIVMMIPLIDAA